MNNASDFNIENGVLKKYVGPGGDVVIPDGVNEIGYNAFEAAKKVKSVAVSNGVEVIRFRAFKGCSGIEYVTIPMSVKQMESQAFSGCTQLKHVEIPNPEALVGGAFDNCRSLTFITASEATMESVFRCAGDKLKINLAYGYLCREHISAEYEAVCKWFKKKILPIIFQDDNASALEKLFGMYKRPIKLDDLDEYLAAVVEKPALSAFLLEYKQRHYSAQQIDKNAEVNAEKELGVRPRSLAEWRKVFAISVRGKEITLERYKLNESTVEIPTTIEGKTVTEMQGTFEQQEYVKTIALPSQLQILGWNVCEGTSISEITIPETVEEIGMFAFADCSQLQKVVFCGAGEIEIDETAFERSEKIVIYAPAGSYAETYAKEHNIPFVAE